MEEQKQWWGKEENMEEVGMKGPEILMFLDPIGMRSPCVNTGSISCINCDVLGGWRWWVDGGDISIGEYFIEVEWRCSLDLPLVLIKC